MILSFDQRSKIKQMIKHLPFHIEMLINDDVVRRKVTVNQNVIAIIKLWQPVIQYKAPLLQTFRHCPAA